jgi:hypothetical protein
MKNKKSIKPPREDVPPIGQAPKAIQNWLLRVGGCNPFREPNYRLVLAQHVRQLVGGEWHDFPDDAQLSERGGLDYAESEAGLVLLGPASSKLERIVVEMRWEERYPNLRGWLLQRWYPGSHPAYGDREEWEKITLKGRPDISLLGPFPVYGEYENCSIWVDEERVGSIEENEGNFTTTPQGHPAGLCLKEVPPLRVLHKAICAAEDAALDSRSLGATRGARMMARLNEWVKREEVRRSKRRERNSALIRDHMAPYWGNSLESARLREVLAKRAGIRSHVGA